MTTSGMDRLTPDNAALLLIDHQTGLFNGVTTQAPHDFRANIVGLAELGKIFKLPTVITTSAENGPNGPVLSDITALLPNAKIVSRPGEINAWDSAEFVAAVEATGRKKLVVAGISTDVCVAFVALSAVRAGYDTYAVLDASGTWSKLVEEITIQRMVQAGVKPTSVVACGAELQGDWRNPSAAEFGPFMAKILPFYGSVIGSYYGAKG
jgi:nicotinamidase-related amidase